MLKTILLWSFSIAAIGLLLFNPNLKSQDAYSNEYELLDPAPDLLDAENSPMEKFENEHRMYDLDESVFDEKKRKRPDSSTRKNGGNPPVPISDHLEILIVGAVVLVAVFYKKLFGQ